MKIMLLAHTLLIFWGQWQYVSLFWSAVATVGQFLATPCLKFPLSSGQWPQKVEEKLCNSSWTVQGTGGEEGNAGEGKENSSLVPGPHLGGKWCPIQCNYRDKHIQICSPCTPKLVRYKPAPVQVTQIVLVFLQHCLSAALQKSRGNCPYRYTPQPALKAAEENSNHSPDGALFALPDSRRGRGARGMSVHRYESC